MLTNKTWTRLLTVVCCGCKPPFVLGGTSCSLCGFVCWYLFHRSAVGPQLQCRCQTMNGSLCSCCWRRRLKRSNWVRLWLHRDCRCRCYLHGQWVQWQTLRRGVWMTCLLWLVMSLSLSLKFLRHQVGRMVCKQWWTWLSELWWRLQLEPLWLGFRRPYAVNLQVMPYQSGLAPVISSSWKPSMRVCLCHQAYSPHTMVWGQVKIKMKKYKGSNYRFEDAVRICLPGDYMTMGATSRAPDLAGYMKCVKLGIPEETTFYQCEFA